jgi:hypothetical protein
MLQVQEFLRTKTFDDLTAEYGIKASFHPVLPLVILNYNQIESPKTHPIVRECRALVLRTDTKEVVARSFPRFFNWGEVADEMSSFDFSNFVVQSKEDGSLILLYWFDGHWRINTRGSFAQELMQFQTFTWEDGVRKALLVESLDEFDAHLDRDCAYVGEFCSPWNKVVRNYESPCVFLLTAFNHKTNVELTTEEADKIAPLVRMKRPEIFRFSSIEQIQKFLQDQASADPTFEGVVIRDCHGHRWKVKSPTYLGLHRLRGEGDNLYNPKHLLPFVLAGEESELLTYFNEAAEAVYKLKSQVQAAYIQLLETWSECKDIENQKDFALAVQGRTPFVSLLFQVRKEHGKAQSARHLRELWRISEAQILKFLKISSVDFATPNA